MPMVMSNITWLCLSCGSKAMALPRRLGQGDGADVHGVRHPEPHRDVEGGDRSVGLDDRGGRRRGHVGEPGRRRPPASKPTERPEDHRAARHPHPQLLSPLPPPTLHPPPPAPNSTHERTPPPPPADLKRLRARGVSFFFFYVSGAHRHLPPSPTGGPPIFPTPSRAAEAGDGPSRPGARGVLPPAPPP